MECLFSSCKSRDIIQMEQLLPVDEYKYKNECSRTQDEFKAKSPTWMEMKLWEWRRCCNLGAAASVTIITFSAISVVNNRETSDNSQIWAVLFISLHRSSAGKHLLRGIKRSLHYSSVTLQHALRLKICTHKSVALLLIFYHISFFRPIYHFHSNPLHPSPMLVPSHQIQRWQSDTAEYIKPHVIKCCNVIKHKGPSTFFTSPVSLKFSCNLIFSLLLSLFSSRYRICLVNPLTAWFSSFPMFYSSTHAYILNAIYCGELQTLLAI